MAGTKIGSAKALATIREKYGEDFFKGIGKLGGKSKVNINPETGKALKGFAISGKASEAGRIGGMKGKGYGKNKSTDSDS